MERPDNGPVKRSVRLYRLFGFTMESDYPFANRLSEGSGIPDVAFSCTRRPPLSDDWTRSEPAYASQRKTADGESLISLYRLKECEIVHIARTANFFLTPEKIVAHLLDPSYEFLIEIHLLGEIFSIWLELHGIPAIHASSVVVDQGAIGFLSTNKGGKSALAATMMQIGYPLLTDDILPVEYHDMKFFGRPGYPQMRMWPDQAEYFLGGYECLGIVHPWYAKRRVHVGHDGFGTFCSENQPLRVLYVPQRNDVEKEIKIEQLSPTDAFFELVRNSFSIRIIEALGLQAGRMDFFANLVMQVPMRRIVYPSGYDYLSQVRKALIEDITAQ
jgi:hypothetical protein